MSDIVGTSGPEIPIGDVLVLRHILTMFNFPKRHWFSGTIPIFFLWMPAAHVYVPSRYHTQEATYADPS